MFRNFSLVKSGRSHRSARNLFVVGLLTGIASVPLSVALPVASAQAASPQVASEFMKSFGDKLVKIINSDASKETKQQQIAPLLFENVDVDSIGRYCLGRYWNTATPAQRTRFLELFHQVLLNAVGGKIGDFKGVSFSIGNTTTDAEGNSIVETIVNRPAQPQASVHWIISTASGRPRVIDLIGEGASLRLTQRNDYSSYIAHNGGSVENLLNALQRQINRQMHPQQEQ